MAFAAAKAIPPGGTIKCGCSSSGRAPPCQGGGSEFEPRQPLQKIKHRLSVDAFCFIRRIFLPRASIFSSIRQHRFAISPVPASLMQKARICPIESVFWPSSAARGCRCPPTGAKGDRTPYGFLSPFDSPYLPFRCDSLRSRSEMRGAHRDVCCSKGTPLMETELFAAERGRPAPDGRALLCAANHASEIQGSSAAYKLKDARNRAPVTPV